MLKIKENHNYCFSVMLNKHFVSIENKLLSNIYDFDIDGISIIIKEISIILFNGMYGVSLSYSGKNAKRMKISDV
jgi:hypothetical protein